MLNSKPKISQGKYDVSKIFSLNGKTALVTGGGGHLGQYISEALALAGAEVYMIGRDEKELLKIATEIKKFNDKCFYKKINLTDHSQVDTLINDINISSGKLDIIVNNAYSGSTGTIFDGDDSDYQNSYNIVVTSVAYLIKNSIKLLQKGVNASNEKASIINIASMYGMVSPYDDIYANSGHNSPPWYGCAKAALIQFTRYTSVHLAKHDIRVNCISPGAFPSYEIQKSMPELCERLKSKIPFKRLGSPEELIGAILFLASNASSYCTGINLPIDGGWTSW